MLVLQLQVLVDAFFRENGFCINNYIFKSFLKKKLKVMSFITIFQRYTSWLTIKIKIRKNNCQIYTEIFQRVLNEILNKHSSGRKYYQLRCFNMIKPKSDIQ